MAVGQNIIICFCESFMLIIIAFLDILCCAACQKKVNVKLNKNEEYEWLPIKEPLNSKHSDVSWQIPFHKFSTKMAVALLDI